MTSQKIFLDARPRSRYPRVEEMKKLFLEQAEENKAFPIGMASGCVSIPRTELNHHTSSISTRQLTTYLVHTALGNRSNATYRTPNATRMPMACSMRWAVQAVASLVIWTGDT